jgi:phosphate transport system permease protein
MTGSVRDWVKSGTPWIWINAGAVSISLIMVVGLVALIMVRGLGQFWPAAVLEMDYQEGDGAKAVLIGEIVDEEEVNSQRVREAGYQVSQDVLLSNRYLLKVGNRDVSGIDFRWIADAGMGELRYPPEVMVLEREEWGNLYGYPVALKENGRPIQAAAFQDELTRRLERKRQVREEIRQIEKGRIGAVNQRMEALRLEERGLRLKEVSDPAAYAAIEDKRSALQGEYETLNAELSQQNTAIARDSLTARLANGEEVEIPLAKIVRAYTPNRMGFTEKVGFYFSKVWEFVADDPREANTEGGIFPAIFGTVLMVMIMSVFVTPLGVLAAVYLREYARQGPLTRLIRIAVNNLAGVPSVVYGVFGLGFFVYFLGSNIDQWFFPEALPAPTFGTPGLLWSSLTLALLTVPVVIVATEEGLARVPIAIREGSLALGATKAETLWRTVLPMATPALMTGFILAVARAAGEVAPLMMVGVVKLAPSLALDGDFPYLHLDRKFMHLGFHIYDVGFQSPNVEAARPLVYATTLLLVLIVLILNLMAIRIRNRLREKYSATEH